MLKLMQASIWCWGEGLLKMLALFFAITAHADVLSCIDAQGKTFFTDNRALCKAGQERLVVDARIQGYQPAKGKINFRVPERQYDSVGTSYKVYIEHSLREGNSQLADAATQKLEAALNEIFIVLPVNSALQLKQLTFYLMWGEDSPSGGRKSGMSYIRPGEPKNYPYLYPRWENVIVIYSANNLMYLDGLWTKKALMHELAHARHLNKWPDNYEPIVSTYRNAMALGLYRNVKDNKGKMLQESYAIKNHLEYFAELSAIYFVGGNYYPFNRAVLKEYDNAGANLLSALWGIQ